MLYSYQYGNLLVPCFFHDIALFFLAVSLVFQFFRGVFPSCRREFIPSSCIFAVFFIQLCPANWSFASASTAVRLSPQQSFFSLGLCPRFKLDEILQFMLCLIVFFRTPLFLPWGPLWLRFLSVLCSVGDRFLLVQQSQLVGLLGSQLRGEEFCLFSFGRVDVSSQTVCSLGSPSSKEGFVSFPCQGIFLPPLSEPGVSFFLAFGSLAQSPVRVKSADGFWHSQMSLLLRKAVLLASLCCTSSPAAPLSCFNRAEVSPQFVLPPWSRLLIELRFFLRVFSPLVCSCPGPLSQEEAAPMEEIRFSKVWDLSWLV